MLQTVHEWFAPTAMLREFIVPTHKHRDFVDVTPQVHALVRAAKVRDGICLVYSPHTTAAITINENADPDVVSDLLGAYVDLLGDERRFQHDEGNSGGHALTSLVGPSVGIPVQDSALVLGRWQAIYLCEFDGPRQRTVQVQVIGDAHADLEPESARAQLERRSPGAPS
jgi:secondary thiamine-phosphate synthase enzyme